MRNVAAGVIIEVKIDDIDQLCYPGVIWNLASGEVHMNQPGHCFCRG